MLADFGRLTRTLDRAIGRATARDRRYKVWLTEYGYQTDPPDPYLGWPWKTQARFLAQAEWLAYRRPRVRSTAQFLLYDDAPRRDYPAEDPRHWGTFQTGLRTADGKKKTAYAGYQRPIFVDAPRQAECWSSACIAPLTSPSRRRLSSSAPGRRLEDDLQNAHQPERLRRVPARRRAASGAFRISFESGDGTVRTRAARVRLSR